MQPAPGRDDIEDVNQAETASVASSQYEIPTMEEPQERYLPIDTDFVYDDIRPGIGTTLKKPLPPLPMDNLYGNETS